MKSKNRDTFLTIQSNILSRIQTKYKVHIHLAMAFIYDAYNVYPRYPHNMHLYEYFYHANFAKLTNDKQVNSILNEIK